MLLAICADRVIDGTGRAPVNSACVLVDGNLIVATCEAQELETVAAGRSVRRIALPGCTLIPGMVNLHEHLTLRRTNASMYDMEGLPTSTQLLRGVHYAARALRDGVTTVRNVGAKGSADIALREAVAGGLIHGPRIFACGEPIAMTGGHGFKISMEADGPDSVRHAARHLLKSGVDWIKLMASAGISRHRSCPPELTVEEMKAAVDEAHRARKKVCAHAESPESIRNAIHAGVDTIEHGLFLDHETAKLMAERGAALVPTLGALHNYTVENGEPEFLVAICQDVVMSGIRQDRFRHALAEGLRIGVGTDTRGEMALELELLVAAGMQPMEALESATRIGAEILGASEEFGTLSPGKVADLVALDGNPLEDMSAIRRVRLVLKAGHVYERALLDEIVGTPTVRH